jgi:hypothetical protein
VSRVVDPPMDVKVAPSGPLCGTRSRCPDRVSIVGLGPKRSATRHGGDRGNCRVGPGDRRLRAGRKCALALASVTGRRRRRRPGQRHLPQHVGITWIRLAAAVSSWLVINRSKELLRDISQGVDSSPTTAPTNKAAVAAPPAPCGSFRLSSTGIAGSNIWKLTAIDKPIAAIWIDGLARRARPPRDRIHGRRIIEISTTNPSTIAPARAPSTRAPQTDQSPGPR